MPTSKHMSWAIIFSAQISIALNVCKQPAPAGCVEPFLEPPEANGGDWELWKARFNKVYDTEAEEVHRHSVWVNNTEFMMGHNAQPNLTYSLTWHEHSDLTSEEFNQWRGLKRERPASFRGAFGSMHRGGLSYDGELKDLPSEVDWTMASPEVVTYVKKQTCGDCWSFSAAGGLEGALAVAIGWTTSLSSQQFVDCTWPGTFGCDGGRADDAMDWAKDNFVCSWDSYPETGQDGSCNTGCEQIINPGSIWGTYHVDANEGALCSALLQRPITVAVSTDDAFVNYGSGILDYDGEWQLDHAVLAVGYGYWDERPFWKIKNSWGTSMGIDGYWLLARGDGKNQNGVLNDMAGVYVFGPYNPAMYLTDSKGLRISAPTQAQAVV